MRIFNLVPIWNKVTERGIKVLQKLYIPESVKTKSEIFNGFGFLQLMQTAVITGIAGIIAYVIYLAHGNLAMLITPTLIVCAASVTMLTKDATNQSVVDYAHNMIAFAKTQKKYEYQSGKEVF